MSEAQLTLASLYGPLPHHTSQVILTTKNIATGFQRRLKLNSHHAALRTPTWVIIPRADAQAVGDRLNEAMVRTVSRFVAARRSARYNTAAITIAVILLLGGIILPMIFPETTTVAKWIIIASGVPLGVIINNLYDARKAQQEWHKPLPTDDIFATVPLATQITGEPEPHLFEELTPAVVQRLRQYPIDEVYDFIAPSRP